MRLMTMGSAMVIALTVGGGQLAVLPGTTHNNVVQRVDWLVSMITAFTAAPTRDPKR